jgi:hypothetical protein
MYKLVLVFLLAGMTSAAYAQQSPAPAPILPRSVMIPGESETIELRQELGRINTEIALTKREIAKLKAPPDTKPDVDNYVAQLRSAVEAQKALLAEERDALAKAKAKPK